MVKFQGLSSLETDYKIGQVLLVNIMEISENPKKLLLSLNKIDGKDVIMKLVILNVTIQGESYEVELTDIVEEGLITTYNNLIKIFIPVNIDSSIENTFNRSCRAR